VASKSLSVFKKIQNNKEVKKQQLSQNEYDALVILAFNIGVTSFSKSSLLKLLNGQAGSNYPTLELAWKAFNKDNGKVSNGLTNRRASEWNIFSKNVYKRI
jgi:type VI secretion system secreted protein VgrG